MSENSYPLLWPVNIPRTKSRSHSQFRTGRSGYKSMTDALDAVFAELARLWAKSPILSTNVEIRLDGKPYANRSQPSDPGAALYFTRDKQRICMPCDRWIRVEDNIYAIAKHIEAMRGMERWGVGTTEQAYAGYKALSAGENWWDVLECLPTAARDIIEAQYRVRARSAHPDSGGSNEAMSRLNVARDQAFQAVQS